MESIGKEDVLWLFKIIPSWFIGKRMFFYEASDKLDVKIKDISVDGEHILVEFPSTVRHWIPVISIKGSIDIESAAPRPGEDCFTAGRLTESIETLRQHVGYPADEHTKPLFEIISALQKELLEIGMKVEELEKAKRGKIKEE